LHIISQLGSVKKNSINKAFQLLKSFSADDEVLLCSAHGHDPKGHHVHIWMENINTIDLGS